MKLKYYTNRSEKMYLLPLMLEESNKIAIYFSKRLENIVALWYNILKILLGEIIMITGELKNKIDGIWDIFWSSGLTNPLTDVV